MRQYFVLMCLFLCMELNNFSKLISQDSVIRVNQEIVAGATLSSIFGREALREIAGFERWQILLNINPSDLEALKSLNHGNEVENRLREIAKTKGFADSIERDRLRERLFREKLTDILDPNQLSLRRIHYLRESMGSPIRLFYPDSTLLLELGMSQEQFNQVRITAIQKGAEIKKKWNDLVEESLRTVKAKLAQDKALRLSRLVGTAFNSNPRSEASWQQIQILQESGPKEQLFEARYVALDEDLKLSRPQIQELSRLVSAEQKNFVRDRTSEISADLDRVLSKEQRASIVVAIQRERLKEDFGIVTSPEVLRYLGINKEELEILQSIVLEASKEIKKFRIDKEMELVKQELSVIPQEFQDKLMELIGNVW